MTTTIDNVFTGNQVQSLLSVHRNTLSKLIADGEFPNAFRIKRAIRIPASDIRNFMERQKVSLEEIPTCQ